MTESICPAPIRDLIEIRERMQMGDGLFREITGVEAQDLFAYRRGKLKTCPTISASALGRVQRCKTLLKVALEMFREEERALDWIYTESPTFGRRSPIDLTSDDVSLTSVLVYLESLREALTAARALTESVGSMPASLPPSASMREYKPEEKALGPPDGILPDARVFRLKQPLAEIRGEKPDLTLSNLAQGMRKRGFNGFSASHASRLANSYTYASWNEVVALAEILHVAPTKLMAR